MRLETIFWAIVVHTHFSKLSEKLILTSVQPLLYENREVGDIPNPTSYVRDVLCLSLSTNSQTVESRQGKFSVFKTMDPINYICLLEQKTGQIIKYSDLKTEQCAVSSCKRSVISKHRHGLKYH